MSKTQVPLMTVVNLWARSGGRCQFRGCSELLWRDDLTRKEMNASNIAHIIADRPGGPRGHPTLSPQLAKDISNLMLVCRNHHALIDNLDYLDTYTVESLRVMKREHEDRIERVTSIGVERQTELILYGANVGQQAGPAFFDAATKALEAEHRYPSSNGIELGIANSSLRDSDPDFWRLESKHLVQQLDQQVRPQLQRGNLRHVSVFAIAPMPLLILLGCQLSDIPDIDVYQLKREPRGWEWDTSADELRFRITGPKRQRKGPVALRLSISAEITQSRVERVLGKGVAHWDLSVSNPHNDVIRKKEHLAQFRQAARTILAQIKHLHGEHEVIHVFPAMPVSTAVEFGRVHSPKADLPLRIYDQNRVLDGFVHALELPISGIASASSTV